MGQESLDFTQESPIDSDIPGARDQFYLSQRFRDFSDNTKTNYKGDLEDFRRFLNEQGFTRLRSITEEAVLSYLNQYQNRQTLAARRLAALKGFFGWAATENIIEQNPTKNISIKQATRKEQRERSLGYLNKNEVEKLMAETNKPRDKAFITIALKTGASVSEILALNIEDIIKISPLQTAVRFKRRGGEKLINLDEEASEIVMALAILQKQGPLFTSDSTNSEGKRISRWGILQAIKFYGRTIGRADLSQRILRNTFVINSPINNTQELSKHLGIDPSSASILLSRRRITLSNQTPQIPAP